MATISELVQRVKDAGHSVEFFGPQDEKIIDSLAAGLATDLPQAFREFLRVYGGGGIVGEWISGIYNGQPFLKKQGSVYGDTLRWREQHHLPSGLIVVCTQDDEVCWCTDATNTLGTSARPVVSFDITTKPARVTKIADSFECFFRDYLESHSRANETST